MREIKDYADSFYVLGENNIVDESLVLKLRQMAKFRNRLVHLYGDIDDKFVFDFITKDIDDIKEFRDLIIMKYIKNE